VCHDRLSSAGGARQWVCPAGHSFDVSREGYVNLLLAGQRRSRTPGDSVEMVAARREFLATGAYEPLSAAISAAVADHDPTAVLDVGCGEGHHTRRVRAPVLLGIDVSKSAVATAARADPAGWYAVASAADLPVADGSIDVALDVFGPSTPTEFARVVRPGGWVVAAHPGPDHLSDLRTLVYDQARPHEVKGPFRHAPELFEETGSEVVDFPVVITDVGDLVPVARPTRHRSPPGRSGRPPLRHPGRCAPDHLPAPLTGPGRSPTGEVDPTSGMGRDPRQGRCGGACRRAWSSSACSAWLVTWRARTAATPARLRPSPRS
jgi:23S rRNA (guanine745-N1)-methyltransferase